MLTYKLLAIFFFFICLAITKQEMLKNTFESIIIIGLRFIVSEILNFNICSVTS